MLSFDLSNTNEYLQKSLDSLKLGVSPLKCMTIFEKILKSVTRRSYPQILKKEDLLMITISSAEIYLSQAKENYPMEESNIEDAVISGNASHKNTIKRYFEFIGFLVKNIDMQIRLTNEHIDLMFKVFVKDSISKYEREQFYKFFTYDEFSASNDDKMIATGKTREHLFEIL